MYKSFIYISEGFFCFNLLIFHIWCCFSDKEMLFGKKIKRQINKTKNMLFENINKVNEACWTVKGR